MFKDYEDESACYDFHIARCKLFSYNPKETCQQALGR